MVIKIKIDEVVLDLGSCTVKIDVSNPTETTLNISNRGESQEISLDELKIIQEKFIPHIKALKLEIDYEEES